MNADADRAEKEQPEVFPQSKPALLLAAFYLKFGISLSALTALLEFLKLNLDFSRVKSVEEILFYTSSTQIDYRSVCQNCNTDISEDGCGEW